MGHKISKEQIDPGVKDHIMSFVGDINELETNEKSNITDAINSLMVDRVDNAENMGKLANAIGEPVTANHSVDEVVEGLGEMLSTFKTNMMNSGVMVESSDKFKSLIDKISTMAGEGGNKGIKFAEGDCNLVSDGRYSGQLTSKGQTGLITSTVTTNLDFTPTYIFLLAPGGIIGYYDSIMTRNYGSNALMSNIARCTHNSDSRSYMSIENITSQSFEFRAYTVYTGSYFFLFEGYLH